RRRLFEWKHLANPFGRSIAIVAELEGSIVGLRALMRWELEAAGTKVAAVRAVDTATDPEVQRRGIFSGLTTDALDVSRDEGVDLVLNTPNDRSRPGYVKMGWQVVGTCRVWVKVRRPVRLAMAALRRDLASGGAAAIPEGSPLLPVADAIDRAVAVARE